MLKLNILLFSEKESIMTPRSRKPVIIGGIRGLTSDKYHQNFMNFQMDEDVEPSFESNKTDEPLNSSLQRSKSENSLLSPSLGIASTADEPSAFAKSNSDETLSTPFR